MAVPKAVPTQQRCPLWQRSPNPPGHSTGGWVPFTPRPLEAGKKREGFVLQWHRGEAEVTCGGQRPRVAVPAGRWQQHLCRSVLPLPISAVWPAGAGCSADDARQMVPSTSSAQGKGLAPPEPPTPPSLAAFCPPQPHRLLRDHLPEHLQPPRCLLQGDEQGGGRGRAPGHLSPLSPYPQELCLLLVPSPLCSWGSSGTLLALLGGTGGGPLMRALLCWQLNRDLYEVMSRLDKQHSSKVFIVKGVSR